MLRLKKSLFIFIILVISTLVFFGCDRKGELSPNSAPEIEITTYAGDASSDAVNSQDPDVFQQTIRWVSSDEDGVVVGYAYRVVNEVNGVDNYIPTPGHEYIETNDGWVYHYAEGANESIPMDSENANITQWTKDVYAVINFPANVNGDSTEVVSRFDLKCIDNRGKESAVVSKYYKVNSTVPGVSISSTSGDIAGKKVGTGIILDFSIIDSNPFVDVTPDHFEFQLYTKNNENGELTLQHDEIEWISTKSPNNITGNPNQYALTNTSLTDPALIPNVIVGTMAVDSTYIVARTVDIAGIYSKKDTISVLISEEFYPGTIIFDGHDATGEIDQSFNNIWVLGQNHYVTYLNSAIGQVIPNINTATGVHFSTPFWIDEDRKFAAINSSDLNIYVNWTWTGNYEDDNPNNKATGEVRDEITGENYYSDIIAYDLRLDGDAYVYPPLPGEVFNITDEDGKRWLRVPKGIGNDVFGTAVLYSLPSGEHRFEVRAVDLQLKVDPTPAALEFVLVDPIAPENKEGILVIDDDPNQNIYSPDALVDSLYGYYLSDYAGSVKVLDRYEYHEENKILHFNTSKFSPTDMQQYKTIIFHSDSAISASNMYGEYDALNIYLNTGGNIISTGTNQLVQLQDKFFAGGIFMLHQYFGVANIDPTIYDVLDNLANGFTPDINEQRMHILQSATPSGNFTTELPLTSETFNNAQTLFGHDGLGTLSYFNEEYLVPGTEVIYRLGAKQPGDGAFDISAEEYDFYNGQPVALKKETGNSKCYLFGVPLSYFEPENVKAVLEQIIQEVEQIQ